MIRLTTFCSNYTWIYWAYAGKGGQ